MRRFTKYPSNYVKASSNSGLVAFTIRFQKTSKGTLHSLIDTIRNNDIPIYEDFDRSANLWKIIVPSDAMDIVQSILKDNRIKYYLDTI